MAQNILLCMSMGHDLGANGQETMNQKPSIFTDIWSVNIFMSKNRKYP